MRVGPASDPAVLAAAAQALRAGRLVVFPTETVYGLGANALDPAAVGSVFAAKGRPADNPLIVHAADAGAARALAASWPPLAGRLAKAFWPGPLTLVVPRGATVPPGVSCGLPSVALRVPGHPVAQSLLEEAGVPVAAPSANRSGRPSPTRVQHAVDDLGDRVEVYVDGGPTRVGLESTVIGLLGKAPRLLRPGAVSLEEVEAVAGRVETGSEGEGPLVSPGMRHRHYSPNAKVHVAEPADVASLSARLGAEGRRVATVACRDHGSDGGALYTPGECGDAAAWAHALFSLLRDLDAAGYQDVVVEAVPQQGMGRAVMDRLRRAARA